MSSYDFSTLSPADFEDLSRDLLQQDLGIRLESFRSGRDKGIDLRYCKPEKGERLVVQAKHYLRSGFKGLKSTLKNSEKAKVDKLKPTRYILTTSVSLSVAQKDSLFKLLSPHCKSPGDILGQEDLNNLLVNNKEIEKQHFKLWLPSASVLERLLHNGVFTQSALEIEEIKKHIAMFVKTEALSRSFDVLEKTGFCMLTGIPGIGKTTTARLLVAQHVFEDWEGIYISSHARDGLDVFDPTKKQIFFYDDFLGLTSIRERMSKNEDKELVQLIKACQRHPTRKRLVLTTREYLYEQARQQNEVLASRAGIDTARAVVELKDYTHKIRAQILVNHLYFYDVAAKVCSRFVENGTARKTLEHRNYNPRIVETMCEIQQGSEFNGKEFSERFLKMLDSPEQIWEHAYRNQLTRSAQHLLLVFAMHGTSVTLDGLKASFRLHAESAGFELFGFDRMFNDALKELEDCFLSADRQNDLVSIGFHNPSVKDFTDAELKRDAFVLKTALSTYTFGAVLLYVAKQLVQHHRGEITATDCLDAMARSNYLAPYCVGSGFPFARKYSPIKEVTALSKWLEVIQVFNDRKATLQVVKNAEALIESTSGSSFQVDSISKLYSSYAMAAFRIKYKNVIPMEGLYRKFLDDCNTPEQIAAMTQFLPENEGYEAELKVLQQKFEQKYGDWLADRIEDSSSSDNLREAIDDVVKAANRLNLDESDLDVSDAESHAEEMAAAEDAQSVEDKEEWSLRKRDQEIESREVDDILGSLVS